MGHYITGFAIYTLAMVGLLFFALFVYKKFSLASFTGKRQGFLKIEDALGLSARKTLYIVKAGEEKFLIAADLDRTTLIAKLDKTSNEINVNNEADLAGQLSQTADEKE